MITLKAFQRIAAALVPLVAALALVSGSAQAASPWWHLSYGSRPSSLHANPGASPGQDEVEKVTVTATGGRFALEEPGTEKVAIVSYNATAAQVQERLEKKPNGEAFYGVGNVEVTGGCEEPVPPVSKCVYEVTFEGYLAHRSVGFAPDAELNIGDGLLEGEATVMQVTQAQAAHPDGQIVVTATNVGNAATEGEGSPVRIAAKLPHGLTAVDVVGFQSNGSKGLNTIYLQCSPARLECTAGTVGPFIQIEVIVTVLVNSGAHSGEAVEATVSGGGAPAASLRRPIAIGSEQGFGVQTYELTPEEEGGSIDTQAGSHPFQLTTTIGLNLQPRSEAKGSEKGEYEGATPALVKDLHFKLPPGLIGNPSVLPQCPLATFLEVPGLFGRCPPDTVIGAAAVTVYEPGFLGVVVVTVPVFNLEPAFGEPARFGFRPIGYPVLLDTALRTGGDYGVTVNVDNITQTADFLGSVVTFWGVPGDARHDATRDWGCLDPSYEIEPCNPLREQHPPPFLSLPTSCTGPLQTSVEADSWKEEGVFGSYPSEPMEAQDGCNRLPFNPSVKVTPDGQAGSTPTGLTVDEHVSQLSTLAPEGLAESDVKGLSVTLPEGVALNPSGADGLQACSMEQIALQSPEANTCPEAAKVGTVLIRTPLLPEPLEGAAYLATQDSNPFGSLVALYVYAENQKEGVRAKATGEVLENPVTGQLTSHFEGDPVFENDPAFAGNVQAQYLPPVPFEDVELHFFGGDRAPLVTPAKCGSYTTTGTFTPWSGNPTTESASTFEVISGPNGGPCRDPLPFDPSLTSGMTSIQAGGFSPFVMTMGREDGEQNLQAVQLKMPLGVSGTLASVKLCGEEQADAGTCGPESEIGETIVSVGVGGDPYTVKGGKVYITGPYKGAPFGLSIVNPAKAGPFDLGKVIVRAKLEVNQETAAITVTTDTEGPYKIPALIDGIPLEIKHVFVDVNRPGFTFNATNCSPLQITGSLQSTEGATSQLAIPYQATNCAVLAFKPQLTASTTGKTSRASGASFTVKLGYPAGPYDANISKVKVELPKALPSRLTTLQKACTAAVFETNPAACPPASIVGHATAKTPVLPVPLSGPAYFVSHGGEAFPSLVIVLQGYGVTVHIVGSTFISPKGITSSTFKAVPDVPVGTFELTLPQGPYSALTANTDLCKVKSLAMPTEFVGQNGALVKTTTKIAVNGCPKHKKATKKHKRSKGKGKHAKKARRR
jgi:hypothetical protein